MIDALYKSKSNQNISILMSNLLLFYYIISFNFHKTLF